MECGEFKKHLPATEEQIRADRPDGADDKASNQQVDVKGSISKSFQDENFDDKQPCASSIEGNAHIRTHDRLSDSSADEIIHPQHDTALYIPGQRERDLGTDIHHPNYIILPN